MTAMLLVQILVVIVTTAMIWIGSDWLEESSRNLAVHYDLPPVVQGGVIAAMGSSFPELASVVFAALAGSFGLGVGAVIGSAIFNILVIPALAVILSPGHIDSTRTLVHKETLFYLLSIVVLFLTFAFAIIYYPIGGTEGELTRTLVSIPLVVYCLYLFLQWQDTTDFTGRIERETFNPWKQWGILAAGLLVILVAVERLVAAVLVLGNAADVPAFLMGVTIVAAATSLPDTIVSVQAAAKHRDVASISNVVGSNTFDLLVVIPVGVLLTGRAIVDFELAAPMFGWLVGATVFLFVTLRTDLVLSQREAYALLGVYGVFLLWILLEVIGVLAVLPQ